MDDLEAELDQLRFDKGARIRSLLQELKEGPSSGGGGSWQQLLDSVRWDRGAPDPEGRRRS